MERENEERESRGEKYTSARIAERCATAAPDTSFAWNVYQHRRRLIIIPRARMHARSFVRSFVCKSFFRTRVARPLVTPLFARDG